MRVRGSLAYGKDKEASAKKIEQHRLFKTRAGGRRASSPCDARKKFFSLLSLLAKNGEIAV